jgi:uncharacterized delta-60 repeat protein
MRKKLHARRILPGVLFSLMLLIHGPSFSQGGLDPAFGSGGLVTTNVGFGATPETINKIALQPDGKIIAVGFILPGYPNSLNAEFIVARYNPDGSLDAGFGNGGIVRTNFGDNENNVDGQATDVEILNDGSILVVGSVTNFADNTKKLALVLYQSNGDLQAGFGSGGIVFIGNDLYGYLDPSLAMQGSKIIIGGQLNGSATARLFRLNADGSADNTFGINGETQITGAGNFFTITDIAVQSDNTILIGGGDQVVIGSLGDFVLYKLSVDGEMVGKVTTDFAGGGDRISSLAIQADGKIVAVGISGFNFALARYNVDGSLDNSFDTDGKQLTSFSTTNSFPTDVAIQPDGKIVVVGNGDPGSLLDFELQAARYLSNGQLDPCFGVGGKLTHNFFPNTYERFASLAIQADGKILFGGNGYSASSHNDFALVRYIFPEPTTWYLDADGDGYGDDNNTIVSCTDPSTPEIICGMIMDPSCTVTPEVCPMIPDPACTPAPGIKYINIGGDCNDNNSAINPGATEVCDGIDNDCDGQIDEGLSTQTWYVDYDNDGYGATASAVVSCKAPDAFWKTAGGDCDDNNSAINPGETEVCDGIDNDCDGQIDEGLPTQTWYVDYDNDGYGVTASAVVSCKAPDAFWKTTGGDCDDNNSAIHPGANGSIELCDGIDNDCDGLIDEGCSGKPTVSISDATVYESEGKAVLTIRLSHITTLQVKINYATSDGTAVSNKKEKDYKAIGNTMLTIPPGTLTTSITVPIYSDNKTENNEYFYINLTKPTNCLLGDVSGMITILDGGPANVSSRSSEAGVEQQLQVESMDVSAYPNPTQTNFRLRITTANKQERVIVKVFDVRGRLVETKTNITPNAIIQLGDSYGAGIYLIQVIQGNQHKELKLIKVN